MNLAWQSDWLGVPLLKHGRDSIKNQMGAQEEFSEYCIRFVALDIARSRGVSNKPPRADRTELRGLPPVGKI